MAVLLGSRGLSEAMPSGRPGIVFWQATGGDQIRLARPKQTSFSIAESSIALLPTGFVMDWSPGLDGYAYTVECRDTLVTGTWVNAMGAWPTMSTVWTNQATSAVFRTYRVLATPF